MRLRINIGQHGFGRKHACLWNLTESDPDTVLYPINLASLKAFYDEVNETSANDLFLVPPQLPPFN